MKLIQFENPDGTFTEFVEIETSEGHFTQMPKSAYDEQQAAQATLASESNSTGGNN